MSHREHAAMEPMQATGTHAVVDRARSEPRRSQRVEVHDAVLRRGERGDSGVRGSPGVDVLHVST
jgi:hypothetical protein